MPSGPTVVPCGCDHRRCSPGRSRVVRAILTAVSTPQPVPPGDLHLLAGELLDALRGQPASAFLIIGGGVALQHYCAFRATHDLDAWYTTPPSPAALAVVRAAVEQVATRHGYTVRERTWGQTTSLELLDDGRPCFSLQFALRDIQLEEPLDSAWLPIKIETFADTVASKMVALVERGAPRDFVDIFTIVQRHLCSYAQCWGLWQRKMPDAPIAEARMKVEHHLQRIEARVPLDRIDPAPRAQATALRAFFHAEFANEFGHGPRYQSLS